MTALPAKIIAIHAALAAIDVAHAFGGALALAWCTERARGTIDIDVNVFVDVSRTAEVLGALPDGIAWSPEDLATIERDGQTRLWWDGTPVDIFLNTTEFHTQVANRSRVELFADGTCRSCHAPTWRCSRRSSTARRTGRISKR